MSKTKAETVMVGKLSSSSGIIYKVFEALQDITTYSSTSGNAASGKIEKGAIFEGELLSGSWVKIHTIIKGSYSGMGSTIFCKTSIEGQDTVKEKTEMEGSSSAEDATGSTGSAEDIWADDAFTKSYSSIISNQQYLDNLKSGLKVSNLRGIMGLPHQFLPNTDIQILDD